MSLSQAIEVASLAVEDVWQLWESDGYGRLNYTHLEKIAKVALCINPSLTVDFKVLTPSRVNDELNHLSIQFRIDEEHLVVFLPYDALSGAQPFRASAIRLIGTMTLLAHLASEPNSSGLGLSLSLGDYPHGCDLAFCATDESHLVPDSEFLGSLGYSNFYDIIKANWVEWKNRENKIFWRGSTTGQQRDHMMFAGENWYQVLQRVQACYTLNSSQIAEHCDVGFSNVVQISDPTIVSKIYENLIRSRIARSEQIRYRFHIDMDGNSNAWAGLFQALLMGSCILKVASERGFSQWYYGRMEPWVHFIPVEADLSDLVQKAQWALENEEKCHQIALNAHALASSMSFDTELKRSTNAIIEKFKNRYASVRRSA